MPAFVITGSIGSGKSTAFALLAKNLGLNAQVTNYSADEEIRHLLNNDPEVRRLICLKLGISCYDGEGKPNRGHLFHLISTDPVAKKTLEEILHPRLEGKWKPQASACRNSINTYFLAEIPLLYEKQLEGFFNKCIVIACSDLVRNERLRQNRSLSSATINQWLKLQNPQQDKILWADHILWNDGSSDSLESQIQLLTSLLKTS